MKNYIQVLLFAGLADRVGTSTINITVNQFPITAQELKNRIREAYPQASALIDISFTAVNQEYATENHLITGEDEVALIPPVSGGDGLSQEADMKHTTGTTSDGMCVITSEPLSPEETLQKVLHPNHGASLNFVGTTREMTGDLRTVSLEYEAYIPMALHEMQKIRDRIEDQWPGTTCAISHRIGAVSIGEISVVIAISSPHRDICYEASRYAIEELKRTVPIWKKEIWEDGSEWKGPQSESWDPITK